MVEQRTFNPWVQGSSPWRPTPSDLGFYRQVARLDPFLVAVLVAVASARPLGPLHVAGGEPLSPQGLPHPVGGVLGERRGDVGIALGLAELGVPEDLLHDANVDALA